MEGKDYLMEFYGEECPHCEKMKPLVEQLERELDITVAKYEVWHNDTNREMMTKLDVERCDGVPFFYNTRSKRSICGEAEYADLLAWASAEQ